MDHNKRFTCRKAAVFSDIHSNYHAFRACYEDAAAGGAELFVFLGDYISDLADPRKTLDLVYEIRERYPTVCLRGNRERYMLECGNGRMPFSPGSKTGSLLYTYSQLLPRDFKFFESLPVCDRIELNGIPMELAHGWREDDRFYFEGADDPTETVLGQMRCGWLLAGHSHKQYIRQSGGKTILNPGSVGVPRDHGALTQYAMLEFAGQDVQIRLRQIPYDVRAMIHRQFDSDLMALAPHWAVSVLYDVVTGEEYTMELLKRLDPSEISDERAWRRAAAGMGMRFTEDEITEFYERIQYCEGGC